MTSVVTPFSRKRTASSTAISANGFALISALARSTPLPSALTHTLTLWSKALGLLQIQVFAPLSK